MEADMTVTKVFESSGYTVVGWKCDNCGYFLPASKDGQLEDWLREFDEDYCPDCRETMESTRYE
jgi:ssDNA-binding Zn-finger/Zn-ribbon topoisomerase 1